MTGSSSPFLGEFGEVPAKGAQGGSLYVLLVPVFGGHFLFGLRRGEVRVEFLEDFVAGAFDVDFQALEHPGGDAFALAQQAEQDVLGADVGMVEALGLLACQREHFLHARRVRDVADHLGFGAAADLFFDLHAHGLHVETHLLQHVDGNTLAEFDQAEEQMLGPDVIVVEAIRLFPGQGQHLLRSGSKIIHHFRLSCNGMTTLSNCSRNARRIQPTTHSLQRFEHTACPHLNLDKLGSPSFTYSRARERCQHAVLRCVWRRPLW